MFSYRAEVEAIATRHELPPDLVQAVCMVESSGNADAFRFEPRFWATYMAGKPEWDGAVVRRVSSSYGLMQVLYVVALENGYPRNDAPEYLFVPTIGLEYGCRVLAERLKWAKGDVRAALASYNGGKRGNSPGGVLRNADYAAKVLAQLGDVRSA